MSLPEWITARDLGGMTRTEWVSQGEGDIAIQVPLGPELQRSFDNLWPRYLPALGFSGPVLEQVIIGEATGEGSGTPIYGEQMTSAARDFIARMQAAGYDMVAYAPNWQARHQTYGIRTPAGDVVGQTTIDTGNDVAAFIRGFVVPVFSIAGGFAFLGQQAAAITGLQPQTAASIIRTAVNVASGGDIERSLIGTIAPAVIAEYGATTILSPPELGTIEPELLQVESVAVELAQELPPEIPWADVLPEAVAELPPELLPPPEPIFEPVYVAPPEPVFEPLPELVFEPVAELPPELLPPPDDIWTGPSGPGWVQGDSGQWFQVELPPEPLAELPPVVELPPVAELLPPPEPVFEPVYVAPSEPASPPPTWGRWWGRGFRGSSIFGGGISNLDARAGSVLEPEPPLDLPPALPPPTIETPGAPTMEDFFTADDYAFPGGDGGFGFDFDTLEPIPTVDAGDWFVGPMPLPDFPAIEEDIFEAPVESITTEDDIQDLITVGDISTVTVDELANYTGTGGAGGIVETGGTAAGTTVVQVLKEATSAMVAALGLVQAYRSLTSKPAPNPVAQARQGQNTVRANPNGTITTTAPNGQTRTARPPVGQPQMTTDGTMIVNNGDGTYTRIGRDGQSVINRYPLDITERFGAAASSPYTLPLLLAGGAALVLFATRKR